MNLDLRYFSGFHGYKKLNKAEDCVEEWDFIFVLRVENVHAY